MAPPSAYQNVLSFEAVLSSEGPQIEQQPRAEQVHSCRSQQTPPRGQKEVIKLFNHYWTARPGLLRNQSISAIFLSRTLFQQAAFSSSPIILSPDQFHLASRIIADTLLISIICMYVYYTYMYIIDNPPSGVEYLCIHVHTSVHRRRVTLT